MTADDRTAPVSRSRPAGPSEAGSVERVDHTHAACAPSYEHAAAPEEKPRGGNRGEGDESDTKASDNHLHEKVVLTA